MKTFTSPMSQTTELQTSTGQKVVPEITSSINGVMALLGASFAAAAIVTLSVWVSGLEMSNVLAAAIWGVGFVFFGLAVDNEEPKAVLQLLSGLVLLALAWLQTNASPDFAIVSGVLVAAWVALSLYKRLR